MTGLRWLSALSAGVLLMTVTAAAGSATLENSGGAGYKAVRLTPEIYNNANADLSDLRLWNSQGEAVPYFLNDGYNTYNSQTERYPMQVVGAFQQEDAFYFDLGLVTPPNGDVQATSLLLQTASVGFAKRVELLGSYDNRYWEPVQEDTIYNIGGNVKLELELAQPQKYPYYRLRLANNLEKIALSSAELCYSADSSDKGYFLETLEPVYTVSPQDQLTVITLEGVQNLRLAGVTLHTDSMFQRQVEVMGQRKELYNLSFAETAYTDTTLPLDGRSCGTPTLAVTIRNNDDKPIAVQGITLQYYADELVFQGGSGSYRLEFGADPEKRAPVYDIAAYRERVQQEPIERLDFSAVTLDPPPPPTPEPRDYTLLFNLLLVVVTLLLLFLVVTKLRKLPKSPEQ